MEDPSSEGPPKKLEFVPNSRWKQTLETQQKFSRGGTPLASMGEENKKLLKKDLAKLRPFSGCRKKEGK
jgi:hypothetical protein